MQSSYFFISQYATRRLSDKCDNKRKFIVDGYNKADATGNQSFRGWIYEFDVDYQLDRCVEQKKKLVVTCAEQQQYQWAVSEKQSFRDKSSAVLSSVRAFFQQKDNVDRHLWLKPDRYNQPCYDFLHFTYAGGALCMHAVNATIGQQHGLRLDILKSLAHVFAEGNFAISSICFFFITPIDHHLAVSEPVGDLVEWWGGKKNIVQLLAGKNVEVVHLAPTSRSQASSPASSSSSSSASSSASSSSAL
jgi:hypothetical protein